jgi:hypothetical protein
MSATNYYKITYTRTDRKGKVTVDEYFEADDTGSIKEITVAGRSKTNAVGAVEVSIDKISGEAYHAAIAKTKESGAAKKKK